MDLCDGTAWYLSHGYVLHARKPNKLRLMLHGNVMYRGVSLSAEVYKGPDLMNSLVSVLVMFREVHIVVIEGMFNQVLIPENDHSAVRLLCWEDCKVGAPIATYECVSHPFGGISCPSAANFAVKQTVKEFGAGFNDVTHDTVL